MEQKFKIFHEYVFIVFITLYISNETWIGATFILRLAFSAYPSKNSYFSARMEEVRIECQSEASKNLQNAGVLLARVRYASQDLCTEL